MFKNLALLLSPKKNEFANRLRSKRKAEAADFIRSRIAVTGTAEHRLRAMGMESLEHAVSPDATIVMALEKYRLPRIVNFYAWSPVGGPFTAPHGASPEQKAAIELKRINDMVGHIHYLVTNRSDAASLLPHFSKFSEYLDWLVKSKHANNPYLRPEDGFTEAFYDYAIAESEHVFR